MKPVFALLSPAGPQARLPILIFHRVLAAPDPLFPGEIDTVAFDAICRWVRNWHEVLPLDLAVRALRAGELPARAMSITFDDGYADNVQHAMPVLQRYGLPATVFVATGFLDGGRMWNDAVIEAVRLCKRPVLDLRHVEAPDGAGGCDLGCHALDGWAQRRAAIDHLLRRLKYLPVARRLQAVEDVVRSAGARLPDDLMMSTAQLREWRDAGLQVGAHTVHHPILARLDDAEALREMVDSRETLEGLLGQPVTTFAYPNGRPGEDYTSETVDIARRAGFEAAVTTSWAVARSDVDPFEIPRFTPWDRSRWRFGLRLAMSYRWHPARAPASGTMASAAT